MSGSSSGRLFSLLALAAGVAALTPAGLRAQAEPERLLPPAPHLEYEGAIRTGLALRRLGNTARLLHIGAHPDDENTALFSPLALGRGADAAYLSLNRGEGGQNGIGPELGTALGLIRTEELLSARGLDGATQFFTRTIDFGFSKTADETFEHWPRDSVLADIVAIIRRYRPDVVVPAWSGTPRDGHGQHQAAGILAREAILAAGDPTRFPEQIAAGLRPFTPRAVYWSTRYAAGGPDVELNTGELDPLLGRSYHQIAMASRSRHESQDMGVPQAPGPRRTAFDRIDPANPPDVMADPGGRPTRQLEGRPGLDASLFAGVDTMLSQRATRAGATVAAARLRAYEAAVAKAREDFDPLVAGRILPTLAQAARELEAARNAVDTWASGGETGTPNTADELRFHLAGEAGDLRVATLAAANVQLDAEVDDELVTPGQSFELTLSAWNGGADGIRVQLAPALPAEWTASPVAEGDVGAWQVVASGERVARRFTVHVPGSAEPTHPYFLGLRDAAEGRDLYEWPDDYAIRGLPFAPSAVRGRFTVELGTRPAVVIQAERDAVWVGVDPHRGEYRRPVRVVPAVSVTMTPGSSVIPLGGSGADGTGALRRLHVSVRLQTEAPEGLSGILHPAVFEGWTVTPAAVDVDLARPGAERTIPFEVTPPADLAAGEYAIHAIFATSVCGRVTPCAAIGTYAEGYELVDYPHIDPHHLYRPASTRVRAFGVRVAKVRVGYVAGVPDAVPEALDDLGVSWEALDEKALAEGDLSQFDVIVTGTRAYEFRPDLVAHNERLLDWVRAGGTLIVQYNKYPALEGSYAPWPVTIARPHGRVTEEDAPVDVLQPDHPIFNTPNRIGPGDWAGWVQERGLYFWDTWEGPLQPLLSMHDPGEPPLEGSLLVGPLGRGTYVYSALALFRQLPAGVPGGYRLLANLVSLGAAPRS